MIKTPIIYEQQFAYSDLVDGKITITHGYGLTVPVVSVKTNAGKFIPPSNYRIKVVDSNNIEVEVFHSFTDSWVVRVNSNKYSVLDAGGVSNISGDFVIISINQLMLTNREYIVSHNLSSNSPMVEVMDSTNKPINSDNFDVQTINNQQLRLTFFADLIGNYQIKVRR